MSASLARTVDAGVCKQLPDMGAEGPNSCSHTRAASTPETEPLPSSAKIAFLPVTLLWIRTLRIFSLGCYLSSLWNVVLASCILISNALTCGNLKERTQQAFLAPFISLSFISKACQDKKTQIIQYLHSSFCSRVGHIHFAGKLCVGQNP